jgi:hypothetical protein
VLETSVGPIEVFERDVEAVLALLSSWRSFSRGTLTPVMMHMSSCAYEPCTSIDQEGIRIPAERVNQLFAAICWLTLSVPIVASRFVSTVRAEVVDANRTAPLRPQ